jgi:hypothetical protein
MRGNTDPRRGTVLMRNDVAHSPSQMLFVRSKVFYVQMFVDIGLG